MSSGFPTGLPVTYVGQTGGSGFSGTLSTVITGGTLYVGNVPLQTEAVVMGGTMSVMNADKPLNVFVTGGTVTSEVTFAGSISTDIGNVKIEDKDDNYAVCPPAATGKDAATTALVVQHIDLSGRPLDAGAIEFNGSTANTRLSSIDLSAQTGNVLLTLIHNSQGTQSTQTLEALVGNVFNAEGTLATNATAQTGNAILTLIHNSQGTQSTQTLEALVGRVFNAEGTLAAEATQQTGNATLTAILNSFGTLANTTSQTAASLLWGGIFNNQGTQATAAAQTLANAILTAVYNTHGTLATSVLQTAILNSFGTLATSALQTTGNAAITAVLNAQGTQATEATLGKVFNAQGTLATASAQTTGNATMVAVMNYQGTQATELTLGKVYNAFGTLVSAAAQGSGNANLINAVAAIYNTQGTQATSVKQDMSNSILTNVYNNQGTQSTSLLQSQSITNTLLTSILYTLGSNAASGTNLEATLFNAVTGTGVSSSVNVSGYTSNTVQVLMSSGSAIVAVRTSLDGVHWDVADILSASNNVTLEGSTKYLSAAYMNGNATVTVLLNGASIEGGGGSTVDAAAEAQFAGSFASALGATSTPLVLNNANTIGFWLQQPVGTSVLFEASWDGVTYRSCTLRQMGADGYSQASHDTSEYWIGSVAAFNYFRFRVIACATPGGAVTWVGKGSRQVCTLEGIEHGYAPHKFGCLVRTLPFVFAGSAFGSLVWPAPTVSGNYICITDLYFTVDATTDITFSCNLADGNDIIFKGNFKPASSQSQFIPVSFKVPHIASAGTGIYYRSSASANVYGVIHGYETGV